MGPPRQSVAARASTRRRTAASATGPDRAGRTIDPVHRTVMNLQCLRHCTFGITSTCQTTTACCARRAILQHAKTRLHTTSRWSHTGTHARTGCGSFAVSWSRYETARVLTGMANFLIDYPKVQSEGANVTAATFTDNLRTYVPATCMPPLIPRLSLMQSELPSCSSHAPPRPAALSG